MPKLFVLGAVALGVVMIAGSAACRNEAAEATAAIKAANDALGAAKAEAKRYIPDQYKAVSDDIAAAGALYDRGDYRAALSAARELPAKANALNSAAASRKQELSAAAVTVFRGLRESVPGEIEMLTQKMRTLTGTKPLPRGIDIRQIAAFQAQLDGMISLWARATAAFDAGDALLAADAGGNVQAQAEALSARLSVAPAAQAKPTVKR